jgi:integrase
MSPSEIPAVAQVLSAFVPAHSFRHWHVQPLIHLGASTDQVQSVLGNARAQTTKDIYVPESNVSQILQWEEIIHQIGE